ncbi:MAG: uracil-DNA glycosylase, partial [Candidatus Omnitrophica bacterium]|nr:uracil-DNA glycosylase [Candidatus Omnitrophota bacterium]
MKSQELKNIVTTIKRHVELERLSGIREVFMAAAKATDCAGDFEALKREVTACTHCELSKTRTHCVFGSGSASARLMFVGEAPGMDEDLQGLPFVGRAGQLLTKIIEAMGLKRQDVYIANVLKCRPPGNRNPLPTEVLTCEGYLIRQIDIIKPAVISALGKFAAQTLLRTETPITKLRGNFYD